MSMSRPPKHPDLMNAIKACLDAGQYLDTRHAGERGQERQITRPEVLFVLRNGFHEGKKDEFKELYQAWNYAVRGRTIDRRELRIAVSFDESGLLIITAIDLK